VAAHKNLSLVQAIAHINDNPKLLLLEQQFGEQKRAFTSFHIPKQDTTDWHSSVGQLGKFLSAFKCKSDMAGTLLKKQQAQVDRKGTIRLFAKEDSGGALELEWGFFRPYQLYFLISGADGTQFDQKCKGSNPLK
jgi:hypothetical protein